MGCYYYKGNANSPDYVKALNYFQKSAELGSPDGLYGCSLCHKFGGPSIRDYNLAFKELRQAVDLYKKDGTDNENIPLAQYNLAICYQNGVGTAKDYKKAFYWFSQAAKNQNNDAPEARKAIGFAQYNVAYYYYQGMGTAVNVTKAKYWLRKSAANGCQKAKEWLREME